MKEKSIIQQNLKKIIGVIVVSVFAIITIYTVFRGSGISLNELTASLKEASWEGILLASVSMLGFIYFEGEALRVLVRHMGYPAKRSHGFVYSAADVYFSAITPSASGGQPASAYFMLKDGIAGTAVYGNCGGGLAILSSLSDFTFMEDSKAKLFVNSPNALDGNNESKLDSASAKFQAEAGVVDFTGDEETIANGVRQLVSMLPANNEEDAAVSATTDDLNRA